MKATIERLTTGKRINHASDDATGLATANTADADARVAFEKRKSANNDYYAAAANDGYLEEATNLVLRAVELQAGGNASASEMTSIKTLAEAAATKAGQSLTLSTSDPKASLATIAGWRQTVAANMATAQSNANLYGIEYENQTAIKSNIMDADIGAEVVNLTKWQILSQAGNSALTNANTSSQYVLNLLR